jgi:hypothetical protein
VAELETLEPKSCCSPATQQTCCDPKAKSECCGEGHGDDCGCSASRAIETDEMLDLARANQREAGTENVEFVHKHASSAIIRARLRSA